MMAKIKAFEARAKEAAPGEAPAAAPAAKRRGGAGGARRGGVDTKVGAPLRVVPHLVDGTTVPGM